MEAEVEENAVEEKKEITEVEKPAVPNTDEFAYCENSGFTSEIYKIELRGLPKYYGFGELKKLLNVKLKLSASKVKAPGGNNKFAYVCFRSEEDRKAALRILDGYTWKNKAMSAYEAKPAPDPLVRKRKAESENAGIVAIKKQKTLPDSVTPLAYMSYEDQLKQKQSEMGNVLQQFGNEVWKACYPMREFIEEQRKKYDQLPCELLNIKGSPLQDGYRNKCEFSIGKNPEGKPQVGFRFGSYSNGFIEVGAVDDLKNISAEMKNIVKLFTNFVRSSKYEVYSPETYKGFYRQLMIRQSYATKELMVVVGFNPQTLNDEELKEEQEKIIKYFTEGDGKEAGVTSLYYEVIQKRRTGDVSNKLTHLHGTTHIVDEIHGLKFRISPEAFFQINTPSANILYQTVIDLARPNEKTTVLDVCCGTGTIGLCFAKHCKKVLGVEIVKQAIEDADFNAKENGVENCKFEAGNCDDFISYLVKSALVQTEEGEDIVAVVDPPRAGLQSRSIVQLRNAKGLNKLIYVSCNPQGAIKNWIDLIRPCTKAIYGDPFVAKTAVPIDLFPHSKHTELVILFEREPKVMEPTTKVPVAPESEQQFKEEIEKKDESGEGKKEDDSETKTKIEA